MTREVAGNDIGALRSLVPDANEKCAENWIGFGEWLGRELRDRPVNSWGRADPVALDDVLHRFGLADRKDEIVELLREKHYNVYNVGYNTVIG